MKLLLDEMYPAAVAAELRARGHDAIAVVERLDLHSVPDPELFTAAQSEQRAVVTENVRDFVPIANGHDARGVAHHGLVLVHPQSYPRGNPRTIGAMVTALSSFCASASGDVATSLRHWL